MRLAVVSHPCFRAVNRRVHVALAERGVEVLIIAPNALNGVAGDPPMPDDPQMHFLPLTSSNPRTYRFVGAEAVLAEFRPDAILVESDPVSRIAVSLGRWAHKYGAKCLCLSVDNLDFGLVPHLRRTGLGTMPQVLAKNALHAAARRLVDAVFTISADGSAVFRKRGYPNVVQVPLGFEPKLFHVDPEARARVRAKLGLNEGSVTFGYFGRVVHQKGVHLIVEALARLARDPSTNPDWRLLLDHFQPTDYSRQIERQIDEAGLASRVIRFEARHEEVADYMRAADAIIIASLSTRAFVEQYGRVVPEAMACGALAIVSNSGAPKELIGDCGIVVPEGDVDRLSANLKQVLRQPESFSAMRTAGAERASLLYSIKRQSDIYLETLRRVVPRCAS